MNEGTAGVKLSLPAFLEVLFTAEALRHREKLFILLNQFVGAALATNVCESVVFFAAKAAPTKTGFIQCEFFSAPQRFSVKPFLNHQPTRHRAASLI